MLPALSPWRLPVGHDPEGTGGFRLEASYLIAIRSQALDPPHLAIRWRSSQRSERLLERANHLGPRRRGLETARRALSVRETAGMGQGRACDPPAVDAASLSDSCRNRCTAEAVWIVP